MVPVTVYPDSFNRYCKLADTFMDRKPYRCSSLRITKLPIVLVGLLEIYLRGTSFIAYSNICDFLPFSLHYHVLSSEAVGV